MNTINFSVHVKKPQMLLKTLTKSNNKTRTNVLFVVMLLPYILLSLTMGGFHQGLLHLQDKHSHNHQLKPDSATGASHFSTIETASHHDADTCGICQWLKTPSNPASFFPAHAQFGCVFTCLTRYCPPFISTSPIHKFTIRPPPTFSC
ncbi:MAG: hypothetical protein MRJ65_05895 [Candidatus Brocadiaceae bacterium]|nr:hypothetical protein [Candidatus Brocadiaceae bacterium]